MQDLTFALQVYARVCAFPVSKRSERGSGGAYSSVRLAHPIRDRRLCAKGGRSSYTEEHTGRSATGILQEVCGSDLNLYGCLFPGAVVGVRVEHVVAGIVREARYLLSSSLSFLLVLNVCAIVGALLASSAAARYDSKPLTVICCLLSATSVGLLSIQPPALVVYVLAALAGLGSIGPQIFVNAWVTRYYPVDSRSRWEALISVSPAWSTIITSSEQK